jgi:hypothetical protein
MRIAILAPLFMIGCGSSGGDDTQKDAPPNVPAMIMVSGTASARGVGSSTMVQGATIAAYKTTDDTTPVVMTTTDANGAYSLVIPTNNMPVDGYIKATMGNTYVATYLYPPAPLVADFSMGSVNLLTPSLFGALSSIAQANQAQGMGVIALEVMDSNMAVVKGATVSSTPPGNPTRYNGMKSDGTSSGLPDKNATATQDDGIAYLFNLAPGAVTVSAAGSLTFKSHAVKAFADQFTTTIVIP